MALKKPNVLVIALSTLSLVTYLVLSLNVGWEHTNTMSNIEISNAFIFLYNLFIQRPVSQFIMKHSLLLFSALEILL